MRSALGNFRLARFATEAAGQFPMKQCPYFQIWSKPIERRVVSSAHGIAHLEIKVCYCTHRESPETLEMAQRHLGSEEGLKCGGSIRRCPLPEGIRPVDDRQANAGVSTPAPNDCVVVPFEGSKRDA